MYRHHPPSIAVPDPFQSLGSPYARLFLCRKFSASSSVPVLNQPKLRHKLSKNGWVLEAMLDHCLVLDAYPPRTGGIFIFGGT
jgi:hypothetical protein